MFLAGVTDRLPGKVKWELLRGTFVIIEPRAFVPSARGVINHSLVSVIDCVGSARRSRTWWGDVNSVLSLVSQRLFSSPSSDRTSYYTVGAITTDCEIKQSFSNKSQRDREP